MSNAGKREGMGRTVIELKDVAIEAGGRRLLEGVRLRVEEGDKRVIRGPSGCGKSCLLRALAGLFPPAGGEVWVDGLRLSPATAPAVRARVAFIGQEPVMGAETAGEALFLPFRFRAHRSRRPSRKEVERVLADLRLPAEILERPSARLSGGEKQRLAVARALLLGKRIFLADEPTSALDPAAREAVMEALFRPGITLLSVSHDEEWIRRCDGVLLCEGGRIREEGRER